MKDISGKKVLITGGSSGIGRATAIEAAKTKAFVGINYNTNLSAAESCLEEVKFAGGDGVILQCDVADHVVIDHRLDIPALRNGMLGEYRTAIETLLFT